jgi:hypothetical protein
MIGSSRFVGIFVAATIALAWLRLYGLLFSPRVLHMAVCEYMIPHSSVFECDAIQESSSLLCVVNGPRNVVANLFELEMFLSIAKHVTNLVRSIPPHLPATRIVGTSLPHAPIVQNVGQR